VVTGTHIIVTQIKKLTIMMIHRQLKHPERIIL